MRSALITIVSGRHRHLRRHRVAAPAFDLHVVVSLGDPAIAGLLAADAGDAVVPTLHVGLAAPPGGLPLAAGRNAGAAAALDAGAELLVFLDVDCLAAPALLTRYADAAARRPDALLCGPVTYLTEAQTQRLDAIRPAVAALRSPHPARPDPADGELLDGEHRLFWSLSFALSAATWRRIGGFDAGYVGYGGEDTDFAARARQAGVGLVWVGGADALHQYHPTTTPPVQHVDDILRNGSRYARRWGEWPMTGWLERFAELGLVRRTPDGWSRADPLRVVSVPPRHPYVASVRPGPVREVDAARVRGWEPDPIFEPDRLRAVLAGGVDLVHVHFGYEHLDPSALAWWLDALHDAGVALVLTVHDLRNPHLADNEQHHRHLRLLTAAAAQIVTLTPGAAAHIERTYGRPATVLPHPSVLDSVPPRDRADGRPVLLVPLGTMRANVTDLAALLPAAVRAAREVGGTVRVDLRPPSRHDDRVRTVRELAARGELELVVAPRRADPELAAYVVQAHAVLLPYRFGTHSGWVELARDLGAAALVPSCGHYREQWDEALTYDDGERDGLDVDGVQRAVRRALGRPRPQPAERAERLAAREQGRAGHEILYRRSVRSPARSA